MSSESTGEVVTLDWDSQALWVQDRRMYLLATDHDPEAEHLNVTDQLGTLQTIRRTELLETHFPVMQATVYKPRYDPVQAFCPRTDSLIAVGDECYPVPSGDALVRFKNGTIQTMSRHEFNCRYQFVGAASDKPPL